MHLAFYSIEEDTAYLSNIDVGTYCWLIVLNAVPANLPYHHFLLQHSETDEVGRNMLLSIPFFFLTTVCTIL